MEEKKDWRTRLYEIVSTARPGDAASFLYDCFMILVVIISLVPLAFKTATPLFVAIDHAAAVIFSIDYLLRLLVADKRENGKPIDFLLFPARPMSIIDILSILPSFTPLTGSYRLLRLARVLRLLRITRVLKMYRYSKNLQHLMNVFRRERVALGSVCVFVAAYVLVVALIVMNVEPETFDTYFDAVYWAAISLTTIGYGDLYPVSDAGRVVTILSSLVGILVVALPTGIITAGIMIELELSKSERRFAEASISRRKQMGLYDPEEEAVREMIKKADALKKWEKDLRSREEALEKEENRREREEERLARKVNQPAEENRHAREEKRPAAKENRHERKENRPEEEDRCAREEDRYVPEEEKRAHEQPKNGEEHKSGKPGSE